MDCLPPCPFNLVLSSSSEEDPPQCKNPDRQIPLPPRKLLLQLTLLLLLTTTITITITSRSSSMEATPACWPFLGAILAIVGSTVTAITPASMWTVRSPSSPPLCTSWTLAISSSCPPNSVASSPPPVVPSLARSLLARSSTSSTDLTAHSPSACLVSCVFLPPYPYRLCLHFLFSFFLFFSPVFFVGAGGHFWVCLPLRLVVFFQCLFFFCVVVPPTPPPAQQCCWTAPLPLPP